MTIFIGDTLCITATLQRGAVLSCPRLRYCHVRRASYSRKHAKRHQNNVGLRRLPVQTPVLYGLGDMVLLQFQHPVAGGVQLTVF